MNANTCYFGDITYEQKDLLYLPEGLFGFEEHKVYLLIHFEEDENSLLCLQSLKEESLAFVLANPFYINPDYHPDLTDEDMAFLDIKEDSPVSFYAICVIHDKIETSTMNLMCPIAINPATRCARQVILDNPSYTFRHPLRKHTADRKEEHPC